MCKKAHLPGWCFAVSSAIRVSFFENFKLSVPPPSHREEFPPSAVISALAYITAALFWLSAVTAAPWYVWT
jgi:hypothetical protein